MQTMYKNFSSLKQSYDINNNNNNNNSNKNFIRVLFQNMLINSSTDLEFEV